MKCRSKFWLVLS